MAHYHSIEEYREKKKKERRNRFIVGFGFLALLILVFCSVFFLTKGDQKSGMSKDEAFPLLIRSEQLESIRSVRDDLVVLTKTGLYVYDTEGKQKYYTMHGCTNPVMYDNGQRFITFDRGGTSLRVDDAKEVCGELTAGHTLLCAQISNNNLIAAITTHDQFASYLQVYDADLNLKYRYGSATESYSMAAFSPDQRHLAACAITSKGGSFIAHVSVFNYTVEETARTYEIKDLLPLYMMYTGSDDLVIVGTDRIVSLNTNSGSVSESEYTGTLLTFACGDNGLTAVVTDNQLNGAAAITMYQKDGKPSDTAGVDDTVIDVAVEDGRVLLLGKKFIYHYDTALNLREEISLESNAQGVTVANNAMFLLGADSVFKYSIR